MLLENDVRCSNMSMLCCNGWPPYDNTTLTAITKRYTSVHGYVALVLSIFGISTNIMSMVVLTRPRMKAMVFNFLLLCLSIVDFGQMLLYVPITFHFYIMRGRELSPIYSKSMHWMYYRTVFFILASVLHTIAIWIVVTLATFRIIGIRLPHKFNQLCCRKRAKICLGMIAMFSVIIIMPLIPFYSVTAIDCEEFSVYKLALEDMGGFSTWLYITGAVMIPCSLLFLQTVILIASLRHAKRRHNGMMNSQATIHDDSNHNTAMLVGIVCVVLICELPYSILPISDGKLYAQLLDILDILSHINNATNFIFYCTLNRNFRKTFLETFCNLRQQHAII